jgi:HAD superfamily hydrolase (TIGR01509 family)
VFDLDGVLVDSEPVYEAAFRSYVTAIGHPELADWFESTLGRRHADFAAELGRRLDRSAHDVEEELISALECVLENAELEPMPFADDAVRRLGGGGRPLGLASSSSRAFIRRALNALGFADRFDAIAAGDEAQWGKPHPELYLTVADGLAVPPAACVAVEDTPAGVAAAVAAGMTVIAVPNPLTAQLDFSAAHLVAPDLGQAVRSVLWLDGGTP